MTGREEEREEQPRKRPRRWRRRLLIAAGVLLVAGIAFRLWIPTCYAVPPELAERPAILDAVVADGPAGRKTLGKSWFLERKGGSLLYLEGDPFTIGYANGTLTRKFLEQQERSLMETVRGFLPNRLALWAMATAVLINNRSLPRFVEREYQYEILGLARAGESVDPYPEFGPRYHRILNYHAAHDISHWVWDKPVVACTAFAVNGSHTRDGHMLLGRNFDWEAGRHFDENKIIGLYRPTQGLAFLSVSWPGMAGAVTGINERRIFCSVNGAHSQDRGRIGTPVSLVVRKVLQYAETLEQAVKIVREAEVFVSDSYLLASGATGEAVVVEKSPKRVEVRSMQDGVILQANHFETATFQEDEGNAEHRREGSTGSRHARLKELVEKQLGRLDPRAVAGILRDRQAPGGKRLALGNRGAINALIATHAVVVDVTQGILWVSRGPHQLGVFDAHSIESFGKPAGPELPADPLLASKAVENLRRARQLITKAAQDPAHHEGDLVSALELNPSDPKALFLLGQALQARGERAQAKARFEAALEATPPFAQDRRAIQEALRGLEND